ncbi:WG repeat-containing protein [Chitinophaga sp.]|uniref:WG repeat-containing protein n=1 Tax=Chitinophaga sp. TaxID=1869181 RepID=UPI0031DFD721
MKYFLLALCILAGTYANAQQTLYRYFDKKWGVTNENKEIVVPPIYDVIELSLYPYIRVEKDGKWGIADTKGKLVLPCEYTDLAIVRRDVALTKVAGEYQAISLPAGKTSASFDRVKSVYHGKECLLVVRNQQRKMAVYDVRNNKMLSDYNYDDAEFLKDTTAPLLKIWTSDNGYGLVNGLTGKEILPIRFSKIELLWNINTPVIKTITNDNKTECYDTKGNLLTVKDVSQLSKREEVYETVGAPNETLEFESAGENKWNIWHTGFDEKKVTITGFSALSSLESNHWLLAKNNNKTGIIDETGKVVLPISYDNISRTKYPVPGQFTDKYFTTKQNELLGLIDAKDLRVIKKPMFSEVAFTYEIVGVARPDGRKVTFYNSTELSIEMARVVMPDGKIGFMNLTNGKVYIPGVE